MEWIAAHRVDLRAPAIGDSVLYTLPSAALDWHRAENAVQAMMTSSSAILPSLPSCSPISRCRNSAPARRRQ
jgi:hypothetical protein